MENKRSNDPAFLRKAVVAVINHMDEEHFSGNELAEILCLSREQTHRKIKQLTDISTGKFIRNIKLLKAYNYLIENNCTIAEVSYKVGFEDPSYFNKCFKEEIGISPGEVKKTGSVAPLIKTPILSFYQLPEINEVLRQNKINFDLEKIEHQTPRKRWFAIVASLFSILLILILTLFLYRKSSPAKIDIRKGNTIAVLPFTNQTGDSLLTGIGDIVSSWIANQLAELKTVKTVPYFTVKQYQSYIGVLPADPEKRPTFKDLVAATYFVTGDYYLKNNEMFFNARFVDALTLEPIYNLPTMHGVRDSVMDVIEQLRLKIAGLITNLEEVKLGKRNPPNYEAYNAYLKGLHEMGVGLYTEESRSYLEKAVRLDSDFVMPRIFLSWFYRDERRDSVFQQIARITTITDYEKRLYDQTYNMYNHNYKESLRILLQGLDEYPQDYFFNTFAGHHAKSMFMPRLALRVLDQLHDPLNSEVGMIWHYYKVWNYVESLSMLGRYQEAMDYLLTIPTENYSPAVPKLLINLQVRLGKSKEDVESFIEKTVGERMKYFTSRFNMDEKKLYADYNTAAAYEFELKNDRQSSSYFARKAASLFTSDQNNSGYQYDIVDALYIAGDFQKTKTLIKAGLEKNPNNDDLLIYLAQTEATIGNETAALKIFNKNDSSPLIFWRRHEFEYQRDYLQARLFALLGKKDEAIALLKKALQKGQLCHYYDFGRDIFLKSLFNHPAFQEIIKPSEIIDITRRP